MENPNIETNDWDWELVPNSDHFSLEGEEFENPSLVDHANQGFTGIDHLGFSDHFSKPSEIDIGRDTVTGFSVDFAESSEIVQNSGNNDVEIFNSVTGISDHLAKSSEIVQNTGNYDVEINSFAKSSEIVQNGEIEINSLTGFSDHSSKPLEIIHQNSGNEDSEINSVTVLSDQSSESSEIVHQNSGNDDAVSFSRECAEEQEQEQHGNCLNSEDDEEKKKEQNANEKRVVWWKVPLEVLKYCVLRVSPVWSLSMAAAALMGFVLLRRRYLYKMKRKSMGLSLQGNVTVHDKKVSQLMSRAARLNEAFSVVKRVPKIRPALPAPGMASWPMMSLR